MTECAQCGDCCTDFPLNTSERADIWGKRILAEIGRTGTGPNDRCFDGSYRKLAAWASNLEVVGGPDRVTGPNGKSYYRWYYRCPIFDSATRLCGDHTNRPQLCVRFPWYGKEVKAGDYKHLSPRCSFVADDPTVKMLPIVEVRHGRADDGPEAQRNRAA